MFDCMACSFELLTPKPQSNGVMYYSMSRLHHKRNAGRVADAVAWHRDVKFHCCSYKHSSRSALTSKGATSSLLVKYQHMLLHIYVLC